MVDLPAHPLFCHIDWKQRLRGEALGLLSFAVIVPLFLPFSLAIILCDLIIHSTMHCFPSLYLLCIYYIFNSLLLWCVHKISYSFKSVLVWKLCDFSCILAPTLYVLMSWFTYFHIVYSLTKFVAIIILNTFVL